MIIIMGMIMRITITNMAMAGTITTTITMRVTIATTTSPGISGWSIAAPIRPGR